eukprot:TRINITY_DN2835_c0_g2_i2.p1 TRINITY_DN2835_c0_g2~~TRINITY_DN2835_c0_g2_i2.p1  ORF type:complete len:1055 (+),score=138.46 TRINITY_DN2835_c0_g2_i2:30-3194(+)
MNTKSTKRKATADPARDTASTHKRTRQAQLAYVIIPDENEDVEEDEERTGRCRWSQVRIDRRQSPEKGQREEEQEQHQRELERKRALDGASLGQSCSNAVISATTTTTTTSTRTTSTDLTTTASPAYERYDCETEYQTGRTLISIGRHQTESAHSTAAATAGGSKGKEVVDSQDSDYDEDYEDDQIICGDDADSLQCAVDRLRRYFEDTGRAVPSAPSNPSATDISTTESAALNEELKSIRQYFREHISTPFENYRGSAPEEDKDALKNVEVSLQTMHEGISKVEDYGVRIGLYGQRGTGKSSLINALLGFELLPTHASVTATAVVTEVKVREEPGYLAEITFMPVEEFDGQWRDADEFRKIPRRDRTEQENTIIELIKVVCGFEGDSNDRQNEGDTPFARLDPKLREILGTTKKIHSSDLYELKVLLAPYQVKRNNLWPLIKHVVIKGKFERFRDLHVSLLDIPGSIFGSDVMTARAKSALSGCDVLFYLCSTTQLGTRDTEAQLLMLKEEANMGKVGLISTKLNGYRSENKQLRAYTVERVQRHFRNARVDWRSLDPSEVPRYLVEADVEDTESLQPFIETEIIQTSNTNFKEELMSLRSVLNNHITSLRELATDVPQASATSDEQLQSALQAARITVSQVIQDIPDESSRSLFASLLPQVPEADFISPLQGMRPPVLRRAASSGYALHAKSYFDSLDSIDWQRLQPGLICPEFSEVFRHFFIDYSAVAATVTDAQRGLHKKLALDLMAQKARLKSKAIEVCSKVYNDILWPTVSKIDGKGMVKNIVRTIQNNYGEMRQRFEAEMMPWFSAWHKETLLGYQAHVDKEYNRIANVLEPLCSILSDGHRLKELLAHLQDIPDDLDELTQLAQSQGPVLEEEEETTVKNDIVPLAPIKVPLPPAYTLDNIHRIDPYYLTAIPPRECDTARSQKLQGTVFILSNAQRFIKADVYRIGYTARGTAQQSADELGQGLASPYKVEDKYENVHYAKLMTRLFMLLFAKHKLTQLDPDGVHSPQSTVCAPRGLVLHVMAQLYNCLEYHYQSYPKTPALPFD